MVTVYGVPFLAAILTLTNAADVARALSRRDPPAADFALTARINDIRLWADGEDSRSTSATLAVDDPSGFVITEFRAPTTATFGKGDVVRLSGHVDPAFYDSIPAAVADRIEVLARTNCFAALPATVPAIMCGDLDYRPVRITCQVRDAALSETCPTWTILKVICDDELLDISVYTPTKSADALADLIGAKIEIRGVVTPSDNSQRKKMGRIFWCWSSREIRVLSPPSADRSDIPEIETLDTTHPAGIIRKGRHRASGRVLAVWQRNNLLIRTDDDDICRVELANVAPPRVGDDVTCIGFPESDLYHINLMRATWSSRSRSPIPDEPVQSCTMEDLALGKWNPGILNIRNHGKAIRMQGEVCSLPNTYNDSVVYLKDGAAVLPVDVSACPQATERLSIGSGIAVTGICVIETPNWSPNAFCQRIDRFTLVIRQPEDIEILSRPSWWTAGRLGVAFCLLAAFLVAILIWNISLKTLAARRGHELAREQIRRIKATLKINERTRLAVDLHDALSQNLTGIALQLDLVTRLSGAGDTRIARHLDIASKTLQSCRNELRSCIWDLRTLALDAPSMEDAIRTALQPHLDMAKLSVRFAVPRSRLNDNTAHTILKIIRELVSDAIRHGKASSVRIAGAIDGHRVCLSVQDNGTGFDPSTRPDVTTGHFGLDGIAKRIRAYNGKIEILSARTMGTKVTISLDLPPQNGTEP